MTPSQQHVIQRLRDEGYAIVVFTPDEVGNLDTDDLESHLVREGNEHIGNHSDSAGIADD